MTGRGRPRKAKSPDINTNQGRSPGKDVTEERQNGATREQKPTEQKKRNYTKAKPCVQSPQKEDRNHCKEVDNLQRTPTEASVPGAKAKTQTTKDCLRAPEEETHGKKAKSPDKAPKKREQEKRNYTKAKPCVQSPQKEDRNHCKEVDNPEASVPGAKAKTQTTKDCLRAPEEETHGKKAKSPDKAPKKREQKKRNYTKAKPCVQSPQKEDRNHCKEVDNLQRTPTEASVPGAKAKTQTTKDCLRAPEEETHGKKAKSPDKAPKKREQKKRNYTKAKPCVQSPQKEDRNHCKEVDNLQRTPTEASVPGAKAKTQTTKDCLGAPEEETHGKKAKSPDKAPKKQQDAPNDTTEVPRVRCKDDTTVDSILSTTLKQLKIQSKERSDASEVINKIIKDIVMHLKQNTVCFKEVEPLRTGSYYENLKISNPDEFDVMLPIPVYRVNIEPFGKDGAFYSVALKRGRSPLQKFQEDRTLSASKMLMEFRNEVKKSVKGFKEWEVTKKKKGCPAVTLITKVESLTISLDVVLCLMVKSGWPTFTKEGLKIESWQGTKVKQNYKRMPYYLVPKYEGRGMLKLNGVLAKDIWRVSFSHIEKAILKNHGSEKTCCEKDGARCCRKDCLKLLKHLLSRLKERDSSFDKFCSYHAKTTLLHACCSRTKDSDWSASSLSHCFQLLLEDFIAHLKSGELYNFFIPTQNLLSGPSQKSCNSLAQCMEEERDKGFPVFK